MTGIKVSDERLAQLLDFATRLEFDEYVSLYSELTEFRRARAALATPRPLSTWHEGCGDVVWWCWRDGAWLGEPAHIGSPLDLGRGHEVEIAGQTFVVNLDGWPGYHTHWTPHPPFPAPPALPPAADEVLA